MSHSETHKDTGIHPSTGLPETFSAPDEDGPLTLPSIDSVMGLVPGFVYVFNHQTFANDYTNRSVGEYLGYSSDQIKSFGDQMLMHVVHPDDHGAIADHMGRIAQLPDDKTISLDYRVITKDGAERWLRSLDSVFDRHEGGAVLRHIGCAVDITSQKQAQLSLTKLNQELEAKVAARTADLARLNTELEERIAQRTRELEEAVVELEQLTFIATHDLKVPANNLTRLALMLEQSPDQSKEERAEVISWINDCAEQLHSKIHGLVLVAQIRLSASLPVKMLNLRSEVLATIDSLQRAGGTPALPVTLDIDPQIEIEFSRFEFGSVLKSLLDNAVNYADPERPLEITITAACEAGQVTLVVADNGTGVDAERDAEKVFGLFQRAHKEPVGNGISLYCAKRMLQQRGGSIALAGARGEGAKFSIEFPKTEFTQ